MTEQLKRLQADLLWHLSTILHTLCSA